MLQDFQLLNICNTLFHSHFPTKYLYEFLIVHLRVTCLALEILSIHGMRLQRKAWNPCYNIQSCRDDSLQVLLLVWGFACFSGFDGALISVSYLKRPKKRL